MADTVGGQIIGELGELAKDVGETAQVPKILQGKRLKAWVLHQQKTRQLQPATRKGTDKKPHGTRLMVKLIKRLNVKWPGAPLKIC